MLSTELDFFAPAELSSALGLLKEHADDVKVLAGGMSMLPAMNLGILRPETVVSFNHIPSLDYVEEEADSLRMGCMVRHKRVGNDPLVRRHVPLLSETASLIADVQVRHRGTIGGSVAHADPAADYLPVLVALDASVKLASADGERTMKAREFFVDVMLTALRSGEAVVEIEVPKLPETVGSAYLRLARVEGSFAIVNVAAIVDAGRPVVAVGGATPTPILVEAPVDLGGGASEGALREIGNAVYAACEDAYGDLNGSPEYRREMARVLAPRAVAAALSRRG